MPLPPLPKLLNVPLPAIRAARPAAAPQPLSQEEEQSLLGGMMSGLQWLGETFDKPGSAARGLLAGEPEQLLNLIPFSDTLGITSEQGWFADDLNLLKKEDRVWGRDLLEQYAGAPKNIPGLFNSWEDAAWDVGGFITEVVTDPLMAVRGPTAALTKAGLRAQKGTAKLTKDLGKSRKLFDEVMQGLEKARGTGKTAKSKLARHLGTTPAEIAREIRSGERALFALKMPFAKGPFLTFGSGKLAAKMLETATYGKYSPIRPLRGLFSSTAGGVYRGELQMAKDLAYSERVHLAGALMNMGPALNKRTADLEKTWMSLMKHHEDLGDFRSLNAFGRDMMETQADLLRNAEGVGKLMQRVAAKVSKVDPKADMAEVAKFTDELHEYLGAILHTGDKVYERTLDLGLQGKMLQDNYGGHFARQPSNAIAKELSKEARNQDLQPLFGTFFQYALGRNPVIRDIPGMTKTVNDIAMDEWLTAVKRGKDFDGALQAHMKVMFPEVQTKALGRKQLRAALQERGYQPATMKGILQDRKELVKALKELDPDLVVDGLKGKALQQEYLWKQHLEPALQKSLDDGVIDAKFYAKEVERFRRGLAFEALEKGKLVSKRAPSAAGAMVDYFGKLPKEIRQFGLFDRRIIDDYFDYMDHLLVSRSTLETAHTFLHGEGVVGRASEGFEGVSLKPTWNAARLTDRGLETFATEFAAKHGHQVDDIAEYAADLSVQPKMANALNAYVESMKPQVIGELLKVTDKISATYRGWLTTWAPAFHNRNMVGGIWQMWADGDLGFWETMGAIRRAVAHVHSRGAKPLEYADEVFRSKLLAGHGWMVENVGQEAAERIGRAPEGFLGGMFQPYKGLPAEELAGSKWRAINPLAVRGGFGEKVRVLEGGVEVVKQGRKNILAAAGEKAYAFVEFTLRGGQYDALRRKGLTPAQAYHTVMRTQFNYSELSKFEKSVMRRLGLFYTWPRKNVPYQVSKLIGRPGGRTAQTMRALTSGDRDPEDYTPRYLREGLAVRMSGPDDTANWLKYLGLPIEDLNKFVIGRGGFVRTAEKFGAEAHPLITLPIERFAQKELWSGRKLKDLRPITGDKMIDLMLHGGPGSRAVSEARRIFDPRKSTGMRALDFLTGMKFTTVDEPRQRAIELRDIQEKRMQEKPYMREFTKPYVPRYLYDKMTPKEKAIVDKEKRDLQSLEAVIRSLPKP